MKTRETKRTRNSPGRLKGLREARHIYSQSVHDELMHVWDTCNKYFNCHYDEIDFTVRHCKINFVIIDFVIIAEIACCMHMIGSSCDTTP